MVGGKLSLLDVELMTDELIRGSSTRSKDPILNKNTNPGYVGNPRSLKGTWMTLLIKYSKFGLSLIIFLCIFRINLFPSSYKVIGVVELIML